MELSTDYRLATVVVSNVIALAMLMDVFRRV